ncbi:protein dispatched homolog 1 isoform X2 [Dermacentor andersoni]|uniref:protein dispatched homolog 1 isoform X2 n=1 Tax=Dermacentor andersoni TaxID=34620 RepID=UPI00215521AF|nr:protein dispatched homolog 1-like isoform X2 [Dermacentor andersoni]
MQWYSRQVANHPSLVIFVVFSLATTAIVASLTLWELPSFTDPLRGFEPRGTVLAQRLAAWKNLQAASTWGGMLSMYPEPQDITRWPKITTTVPPVGVVSLTPPSVLPSGNGGEQGTPTNESQPEVPPADEEEGSYGRLVQSPPTSKGRKRKKDPQDARSEPGKPRRKLGPMWKRRGEGAPRNRERTHYFCSDPSRSHGHVVFGPKVPGTNLFTLEALQSICRTDLDVLRRPASLRSICERVSPRRCCTSWSIPHFVALLHNRSSCLDITATDVQEVLKRLEACAPHYHSMKLSHDCASGAPLCRGVPAECIEYNAVYTILHYLADVDFLAPVAGRGDDDGDELISDWDGGSQWNNSASAPSGPGKLVHKPHLSYTSVFLPIAQSTVAMPYFKDLEEYGQLEDDVTQVVGMELGLKHALFDEYLLHDTVYVALAGVTVLAAMWAYTQSFLVTAVTCLAVIFSLGTAYFLYTTVFRISFFPFMNILTLTIAIGIGADDAFIYCKTWGAAKAEKNSGTLVKLVRDTLHHACLSMLVTSVTTAAAFFASCVSSITAVRCFGLFAGTAVLASFFFTVTWLPAALIVAEKWCSSTCCLCVPPFGVYLPRLKRFWCCSPVCAALWRLHHSFAEAARVFYDKLLPCIVIRLRWFWLLSLTLVAAGGAVAIFVHPRLRLPESPEFQVLSASHLFERYDLDLKERFWFEKARSRDPFHRLPIRIIWGVLPVDTGDYLDPSNKGAVVFDPAFDVADPASQEWLLSFCKRLRAQSFHRSALGVLFSGCFIETLKSWMERRCVDSFKQADRFPCCESSHFPYPRDVFSLCLRRAIASLHQSPGYYFVPGMAGPRFLRNGTVRAIVLEYDSVYSYSHSHHDMDNFWHRVESWIEQEMKSAPPGLRNGWFTSDLEFYDLQSSLAEGTLVAMGVAVGVSFVALLVTTLNLLVSLYAIITIACVICTTVGALVLMGWRLNVLESITVSVAIGLAVDYTIHYGVAYRLSAQDRETSVIQSLSRVGSPVTMAALTSFLAGALMFPSFVLAYLQVGTFLMLITVVSWVYATFFFHSLLSVAGPQRGQLQLDYPSLHCCESASPAPVDKTVYALSESTLSTSSASCPAAIIHSESHELEPLTLAATLNGGSAVNRVGNGNKKKQKKARQRSGSLSAAAARTHGARRKVSLPVVSVTYHGDPSPRHVSGATSSSTIVCGADEDIHDDPIV